MDHQFKIHKNWNGLNLNESGDFYVVCEQCHFKRRVNGESWSKLEIFYNEKFPCDRMLVKLVLET